jgi:signal transduction histidine kinase
VYQLMVKMQVEKGRDEDVLDELEHIYNKSRDISKEYQALDTQTPFDETLTDLLSAYQSDTVKIIKRETASIDWNTVSPEKKNAIYRVLQELMTNMKKHSRATLVAVSMGQQRQKITIDYSDNGEGTVLKKQTGLQNAENRIFTLNGSITFESQPGKGFKAKIIV